MNKKQSRIARNKKKQQMEKLNKKQPEVNPIFPIFAKTETLTDELIQKLHSEQNIPIKHLESSRDDGFEYCESRNSFMTKPQGFGAFEGMSLDDVLSMD